MFVKIEGLSEEVITLMNNMALAGAQNKKIEEIVVRGAVQSCRAGTHYRYLNVSSEDRIKIMGNPVGLQSDCQCGKNICNFGLCTIKTALAGSVENFVSISEFPGTIKEGAIKRGVPCKYSPVGTWENVDERSRSWNSEALAMEAEITTASVQKCASNELVVFNSSGQDNTSSGKHTLEDHEECQYEVREDDPIKVRITENSISIDVYIEYTDADDKHKELIEQGIKKWESDDYKYVYGHKASVNIFLNTIDKGATTRNPAQKRMKIICEKVENCYQKAENVSVDEYKDEEMRSHTWNDPNHSDKPGVWDYDYAEIHMFPIEIKPRLKEIFFGQLVKTKDKETGDIIFDIRELSDEEYVNIVAHEFGHALGLPDNQEYAKKWTYLDNNKHYSREDIMATYDYHEKFKCYSINIMMIIGAARERMQQDYKIYLGKKIGDKAINKCEMKND